MYDSTWVIKYDSNDKWAIIFLFLFLGCLVALSGLYLIETLRIKRKSFKHDNSPSAKVSSPPSAFERIYLVVRNVYLYLATNKAIMTIIIVPLVFAIPFLLSEEIRITQELKANGLECYMKNNPFALMLFSSHEKMNYIHRLLSQFAILLGIIHGFTRLALDAEKGLSLINRVYNTGYAILAITVLLIISVLPWFRRRLYEWFFLIHHVCSIAFLICIYLHHPRCIPYMIAASALYALDRACRILRCFLNKTTFQATMIEDDVIYLRGKKPRASFFSLPWSSGNHVYVNIPRLSFWQMHPFTVASCPSDDYIELLVVVRKGFTRRLANHLGSTDDSTSEESEKSNSKSNTSIVVTRSDTGNYVSDLHKRIESDATCVTPIKEMTIFLDGPYGPMSNPFRNYSYVLFSAAGCGITSTLPLFRDMLLNPGNTVDITFVWACRSLKFIRLFKEILEDSIKQNGVTVHIYCHLTTSYSVKEHHLISETNGSNSIQYFDERPNLGKYVEDYFHLSGTNTNAISACGPNKFLKALKKEMTSQQKWDADTFQQYEEI
ncbi:ferric reductase transmembrane component [Schizosaccharomyces octosporus yFS286]|uniref:ferric-chelate reductase (NADPH) n=1 Tax=Schizosaccharomyces octosporus (strain yFS286) TaxID=483514 RepID=S9Q6W3_SCHOY|nr:ferric reductase transmembrane component [Schizosaccharomyces octosporus yFS286]EPX75383.1 ferric reductase transmembrane component [Schizosaccharomyces octosporus yFS286]